MNYIFKSGIKEDEYKDFVEGYPGTSFMQHPSWSEVKNAWKHDFVGVYEQDKLVCAAMILKRKLFLNKMLFYIPRGYVTDYKNKELLTFFTKELKIYAKKNNAIDVKIDPYICFLEENIQTIKENKEKQIVKTFSNDTKVITENLLSLGYKHGGYKKKVNSYIQPRYTMVVPLRNVDKERYEKEELRRTFPKNVRNYIGLYQEQRGVSFYHSKDKKDIKELIKVLECTEERQHISLRSEKYFKKLMESFPEQAVVFFAKVNIDKYILFLKNDMKENESKKEFCEKQIEEAKKLKNKYGNDIISGATIVLMPTCKTGIKIASFLYAGTNTEVLPSLKITNGLMFYRLCYCLDNGCDYCDLGGVDGSLKDHLSIFKSKFNPTVLELVGEYDLIINKFLFSLFNLGMSFVKFLRSKR